LRKEEDMNISSSTNGAGDRKEEKNISNSTNGAGDVQDMMKWGLCR
jgi:hypothetical protein